MKNASPYKCNVCGKAKEDSNHWWLLFPSNTPDAPGSGFILDRWDDVYADRKDVENICSESCASKALSKWMGEQKPIALREPRGELTCATCGKGHPRNVTTSHHPDDCACGSKVLHAPDGRNQSQAGCVWTEILTLPEPLDPLGGDWAKAEGR